MGNMIRAIKEVFQEPGVTIREYKPQSLSEQIYSEKLRISNLRDNFKCHDFIIEEMKVITKKKVRILRGEKVIEYYLFKD